MVSRSTLCALAAAAAVTLVAPSVAAAAPNQTCQANPVRVSLLGSNLTPLSAGSATGPCVTQDATIVKSTTLGPVIAAASAAGTVASPGAAFATTFLVPAAVILPGLAISATAIDSLVQTRCFNPTNAGSRVVGLTINGRAVQIPANDAPVHIPLGGLGWIDLNQVQVTPEGGGFARAVYIHTILGDVVLGESVATSNRVGC